MDQKPYTTDRPEVDEIAEEILGVFKSDDEMDTTMTPQPRRHQRQEVVVNLHKPIEPQQIPNFWHQPHHSTNTGRTTNGTYKAPGMQMDNPKGMLPYATTPPNQYGPYYDFTGKGTLPPPASPWVINPAMHKEIEKLVRTTFDEKKEALQQTTTLDATTYELLKEEITKDLQKDMVGAKNSQANIQE